MKVLRVRKDSAAPGTSAKSVAVTDVFDKLVTRPKL